MQEQTTKENVVKCCSTPYKKCKNAKSQTAINASPLLPNRMKRPTKELHEVLQTPIIVEKDSD
jgi:hypothetical protein